MFVGVGEVNAALKGTKLGAKIAEGLKAFKATTKATTLSKLGKVTSMMDKALKYGDDALKAFVTKLKNIPMPFMDELAFAGQGMGKTTLGDYMKAFSKGGGFVDDVFKKASGTVDDFTGKLRGKEHTLKNVKTEIVDYIKRSPSEAKKLRNKFDSSVRKNFLKELGMDEKYLKQLGFSEKDIARIKNGNVPQGWQVHHKLPLDDSGTNDFANLVLIENEPWHKVITNHQNSVARGMKPGDIKKVEWPMIDGNIYPK